MVLELKKIHTFYGLSHILFDVSLEVAEGEIVGLLGRNGAGKTTTIRSIIGLTPPKSGFIRFRGEDIARQPPYSIARRGIGYVPSERRLFGDLTMRQNLEAGMKRPPRQDMDPWTVEMIYDLFPPLKGREQQRAGSLSGGEQQMLTIARTLMGNPEVLVLDEPSIGLSPLIVGILGKTILRLKAGGVSVLLAEQNAKFAMEISNRVYVIDKGEIRFSGPTRELQENEELMRTYLAV